MAWKYNTSFHSKAIKNSSEIIGQVAQERSLISSLWSNVRFIILGNVFHILCQRLLLTSLLTLSH